MSGARFRTPKIMHPDGIAEYGGYEAITLYLTQMLSGSPDTYQLNTIYNIAVTKAILRRVARELAGKVSLLDLDVMGDDNLQDLLINFQLTEDDVRKISDIQVDEAAKNGLTLNKLKSAIRNHVIENMKRTFAFGVSISRPSVDICRSEVSTTEDTVAGTMSKITTSGMTVIARGGEARGVSALIRMVWILKRIVKVTDSRVTYSDPSLARGLTRSADSKQYVYRLPYLMLYAPVCVGGFGVSITSGLGVAMDDAIYIQARDTIPFMHEFIRRQSAWFSANKPTPPLLKARSPTLYTNLKKLSDMMRSPTAMESKRLADKLRTRGVKVGTDPYYAVYERLAQDVTKDGSLSKLFRADDRLSAILRYSKLDDYMKASSIKDDFYLICSGRKYLQDVVVEIKPNLPKEESSAVYPLSPDLDHWYRTLTTGGAPSAGTKEYISSIKAFLNSPKLPGSWTAESVMQVLSRPMTQEQKCEYLVMMGGTASASRTLVSSYRSISNLSDFLTSISYNREADPILSICNTDDASMSGVVTVAPDTYRTLVGTLRSLGYQLLKTSKNPTFVTLSLRPGWQASQWFKKLSNE